MTPIQKAKSQLLLKQPFYATILLMTPLVETRDVPTAATDMTTIYWNPDFFKALSLAEIIGVLLHELLHILFLHGLRRGNRDHELWNIACDYAINYIIIKAGFSLPKGCLYDEKYGGWSAEKIYEDVKKEQEKQREKNKINPIGPDIANPKEPGDKSNGKGSKPGVTMPTDDTGGVPVSAEEVARIEEAVRTKVASAATA